MPLNYSFWELKRQTQHCIRLRYWFQWQYVECWLIFLLSIILLYFLTWIKCITTNILKGNESFFCIYNTFPMTMLKLSLLKTMQVNLVSFLSDSSEYFSLQITWFFYGYLHINFSYYLTKEIQIDLIAWVSDMKYIFILIHEALLPNMFHRMV